MVLFAEFNCCNVPKDGYDTDRSDAEDSVMETTPKSGGPDSPGSQQDASEPSLTEVGDGGYEVRASPAGKPATTPALSVRS